LPSAEDNFRGAIGKRPGFLAWFLTFLRKGYFRHGRLHEAAHEAAHETLHKIHTARTTPAAAALCAHLFLFFDLI
jgi:hypothetical protein